MGRTREEIRMNYQKTLRQADALENLAYRIEAISKQSMGDAVQRIGGSWHGDSGENYAAKGQKLVKITGQHGRELLQAAETLRRNANNTYRAELFIIELAERRTYR